MINFDTFFTFIEASGKFRLSMSIEAKNYWTKLRENYTQELEDSRIDEIFKKTEMFWDETISNGESIPIMRKYLHHPSEPAILNLETKSGEYFTNGKHITDIKRFIFNNKINDFLKD